MSRFDRDKDLHHGDMGYYEEAFDELSRAERDWLAGKPVRRQGKKQVSDELREMADVTGLERGFDLSYKAAKHERVWLFESLRGFIDDQLITDVVALVKGGKEANVYRCAAHPNLGVPYLAAKVYRPRMFRTIRNDHQYRQGRELLNEQGRAFKRNEARLMKAVEQRTDYGQNVAQTSWLMHEYMTMERLYRAGGAVPRPVAAGENAILMGYWGDGNMAAPTLNGVRLELDEAEALFAEAWRNVELMLQHHLIHGDLSAYNILYWEGQITLIDFPQVVDCVANDFARDILRRDVERLCDYFASQGVRCEAQALMGDLWGRYVGSRLKARLADFSVAQYAQMQRELEASLRDPSDDQLEEDEDDEKGDFDQQGAGE